MESLCVPGVSDAETHGLGTVFFNCCKFQDFWNISLWIKGILVYYYFYMVPYYLDIDPYTQFRMHDIASD
jgi:hypothetical protein